MTSDAASQASNQEDSCRFIDQHDWSHSPLGDRSAWPDHLRTVASLVCASRFPMFLLWGPERILIYNDAYVPILGSHHPSALGRPFFETWPEVEAIIGPVVEDAAAGRSTLFEDLPVTLHRGAIPEDAWFTFSYSPIGSPGDGIPGVLCVCFETTDTVLARQRQTLLLELEATLRTIADPIEIIQNAQRALGQHLRASRVGYGTLDADERFFTTSGNWTDGSVPHHDGTHDLAGFGPEIFGSLRKGESLVVRDAATDPRCEGAEAQAAFAGLQIRAALTVSLIKEGRFAAALYVHDKAPRNWSPVDIGLVADVAERTWSAVERAKAEMELRGAARRQSFLLALGDRLRDVADAEEIKRLATCALGEHLRVGRAGYGEIDEEGEHVTVHSDWTDGEMPSLAGETRPLEVFGPAIIDQLRMGRVLCLNDMASDPLSAPYAEGYASIGTRSLLVVPLIKNGAFSAILYLHEPEPRTWSAEDAALAVDIAERTWAAVERARAEKALRSLNETLEAQVAARTAERDRMWRISQDIFLVIRADGVIEGVNPAVEAYGYQPEQLVGQHFASFVHGEDMRLVAGAIQQALTGMITGVEVRLRTADGSWRWFSWNGAFAEGLIHAVGRDVTGEKDRQLELEIAQEALRQSQKLEAMGQLTGGVAHDFNNLLTPIIGSLDLLQRGGLGGPREQRLLAGALQSGERAKTLVQRLLAFARRQPLRPLPVDLRAIVNAMSDLIASTSGPRIRLELALDADAPAALADPNQLEMALLNLSVNARDAMPEGGVLSISLFGEQVRLGNPADLRPGLYARLSVADTGVGMNEETRKRAVEPFFSTKGLGQGTGLGLSMVHGLASQLGGALTITSKPGLGTRVDIWLPAAAEEPVGTTANQDLTTAPAMAESGIVLLVDDEEPVRATTAEMLAELGYRIVEASSGDEALAQVRAGLCPDLLVTDHLMPGMTGTELAREVASIAPDVPILIISGYADVDQIAPDLPRLSKPFLQSDLAQAILAARSTVDPLPPPA